ncbi:preprotein translocase subunit SECE1 [Ziziphus jujuba]|uniref:Preprotein translocase subunit SECE1 n=1 Tax=Ziziphus jujuba TaxID=326968 RepID=A0A6P4A3G9_ZIZJJ|nr:preprotein translocase subunit SECE1 [Ziziphus jujuba]
MALPMSLQLPVTPQPPAFSGSGHPTSCSVRLKPLFVICNLVAKPMAISSKRRRKQLLFAIEENRGNSESDQQSAEKEPEPESQPAVVELSELGSEIKKAMEEKKAEKEGDFLSGVAEEVREIEWPVFGKVLGTTGVVISVIAGSSVVLLTVNAVLAELSDRFFDGRGVQDFFG